MAEDDLVGMSRCQFDVPNASHGQAWRSLVLAIHNMAAAHSCRPNFRKCRQHCREIWVSFVLSEARHERPWLGAADPNLRDRSHPLGIVERSRADIDTGGISLRLRMRTYAANGAVIVNC